MNTFLFAAAAAFSMLHAPLSATTLKRAKDGKPVDVEVLSFDNLTQKVTVKSNKARITVFDIAILDGIIIRHF